jgi:hypothetical protein
MSALIWVAIGVVAGAALLYVLVLWAAGTASRAVDE